MVKATVLFIWEQLLAALIHFDFIIPILIDDAWCKLCNTWLLLCENNSRSITILELHTGGKYYCSYYLRQSDG